MKLKTLFAATGIAVMFTASAFAQKGELTKAQESFEKYKGLRSSSMPLAKPILATAKTSIDKAAANEKTATLPQTYALKAAIYASNAMDDSVETTSAPLFTIGSEAFKKAVELDTKKENKELTEFAAAALWQAKLNTGVKYFKEKDFAKALENFQTYRDYAPTDTNGMSYSGIAAKNANNAPAAIENYKKLITSDFKDKDGVYMELSNIYLTQKDTTSALNLMGEAVQKSPKNADLRKAEIEIGLKANKLQVVLDKLTAAIANDPNNKTLYYYAGLADALTADAIQKKIVKNKDAAAIKAMQTEKGEHLTKATAMYKKAVELDPNYFDAILNLGYVVLNPAIDTYNAAQQLPQSKQKEFDAALAKAAQQFEVARPYLEKATQLDPKSLDAWTNLKTYYVGVQNAAKVTEVTKKLAELEKN